MYFVFVYAHVHVCIRIHIVDCVNSLYVSPSSYIDHLIRVYVGPSYNVEAVVENHRVICKCGGFYTYKDSCTGSLFIDRSYKRSRHFSSERHQKWLLGIGRCLTEDEEVVLKAFRLKEEAKTMGLKYCWERRSWYIPQGFDPSFFDGLVSRPSKQRVSVN